MKYRLFGSTGVRVSEVGFGAWAIGGQSYGVVARSECLRALAKAEELGCNFVDTAFVYGDSELILGEFLSGRREKWFVATKYSGQKPGLVLFVEEQLKRLKIDTIDFYQIHWTPRETEKHLYEGLYRLKRSGKVRFTGISLYSEDDIDYVLDHTEIDGFQVPFSLLDPDPFLARLDRIRDRRIGIVASSSLKAGFLTGKYHRNATFHDPNDQRHKWSRREIIKTINAVERFRFLEKEGGALSIAAARYPLSFPEVSTVILGTKTAGQAEVNFGEVPGSILSDESLETIRFLQKRMGLRPRRFAYLREIKRYASRFLQALK